MVKNISDKKAFTAGTPVAGTPATSRASFILQFLQAEKQKHIPATG